MSKMASELTPRRGARFAQYATARIYPVKIISAYQKISLPNTVNATRFMSNDSPSRGKDILLIIFLNAFPIEF